jgi:hypothetical protein
MTKSRPLYTTTALALLLIFPSTSSTQAMPTPHSWGVEVYFTPTVVPLGDYYVRHVGPDASRRNLLRPRGLLNRL